MILFFKKYSIVLWICFLVILFLFFSKNIIKNFHGPIYGYGDTNNWEHTGYFLSEHLRLFPYPKIEFQNNGTLYPFGSNHVFQSWNFEKDFFWLIFYAVFGNGPWLKYYYLLSVLFTCGGSFWLLRQAFSINKSFAISILLTFFNFYSILKYPYHLVYSDIHWIVLPVLLDYIILHLYFHEKEFSVKLFFFRLLFTVLSLGSELGYIAGFNLTSFVFTYAYLIFQLSREKKMGLAWNGIILFIQGNRKFSAAIFASTTVIFLFYSNLIVQVLIHAKSLPMGEISEGVWWSNPLRIILPIFPHFMTSSNFWENLFMDSPEGIASGSIGWFLLLSGLLGLIHSKKQITAFYPFLFLLIFLLSYHPTKFPVLKIFPWFQYMRVSGRITFLTPVLFSIFATGIDFEKFRSRIGKLVFAVLLVIGLTELNHGYRLRLSIDSNLPKDFYPYMETIRNSKGEALLDWPFCIYGANFDTRLCPYYPVTIGAYSFTKFHHKKVIGQYYGRVHTSQIQPFLDYGWPGLFLHDERSQPLFPQQKRCFNEEEWKKFEEFYRKYDFSGINLYTDVLGKECTEKFYQKFGNPVGQTRIPYSGNMVFIPKHKIE